MKKLHVLLVIGIVLVILEFLLGSWLLVYGFTYRNLEDERADEMLDFIKTYNPVYYEKLASRENQSYREEFYSYYTKKGDKLFVLNGMILMFLAINSAIPTAIFFFIHKGYEVQQPETKLHSREINEQEEEDKEPKEEEKK